MQFQFANQGLAWSDAPFLAQGLLNTIRLAAAATLVGTLGGIVLGWLRTVSVTVRVATSPLIDILRSVPMIIQLILANSLLSILGLRGLAILRSAPSLLVPGCRRLLPRWCGRAFSQFRFNTARALARSA